jgi:predicted dehydrogenase
MGLKKIGIGFVSANSVKGWAAASHLPAIAGSQDFELTAVCTTTPESASETGKRYGARHAVTLEKRQTSCTH